MSLWIVPGSQAERARLTDGGKPDSEGSRIPATAPELAMANDPVLIAYTVKQLASGKNVWTRIGAAWPHDSGAGLTLILDAKPLDNKIVLIEPTESNLARD